MVVVVVGGQFRDFESFQGMVLYLDDKVWPCRLEIGEESHRVPIWDGIGWKRWWRRSWSRDSKKCQRGKKKERRG